MATIENQTEAARRAVWAMLTEDTGVHMLDSGLYNGRAWQRNRAKGYATACAERSAWITGYPASTWTSPSGGIPQVNPAHYSITLSAFHFLAERMQPVGAEHPAAILLRTIEQENPDESWLGVIDYFREACEDAGANPTQIYNTYNWENLLGQVWQGFTFEADGARFGDGITPMACISMHNGADVRGGYARPYLFHLDAYTTDAEYAESALLSNGTEAFVYCENPQCAEHGTDGEAYGFHVYGSDIIGRDGGTFDDTAEWDTLTCPQCGTVDSLRAESVEASY